MPNDVYMLISFFRELCLTELHVNNIEVIEKNSVITLCKLEKIFPRALFEFMEHFPVHLAYEAKVKGPV